MVSFIALVVGLSLIFGILMVALAAEVYYMFWWKKKKPLTAREIDEVNTSYVQQLLYASTSLQLHTSQLQRDIAISDPEIGIGSSTRSLLLKSSCSVSGEESVESELMRLHNLAGPPRFLFTIKEETRDDLSSEDRSRKGSRRSLSDMIVTCENPFLTPIASPRISSPTLSTNHPSLDFYNNLGFNPLYEATTFEEIESKLMHSPPPKFKFLRDAEEKLYKRLKEQMLIKQANMSKTNNCKEDQIGSLITLISGVKKDNSTSSKILPLTSSPSRFKLQAT